MHAHTRNVELSYQMLQSISRISGIYVLHKFCNYLMIDLLKNIIGRNVGHYNRLLSFVLYDLDISKTKILDLVVIFRNKLCASN